MNVPVPVLVAQWVVTFAFGGFLILAFRQVAHLLHLVKVDAGAAKLEVGAAAPMFAYRDYGTGNEQKFDPRAPAVLLFVEPTCANCLSAARWLAEGMEKAAERVPSLLLTTSPAEHVDRVPELRELNTPIGLIDSRVAYSAYGINGTPFIAAIGTGGRLVASELVRDQRAISSALDRLAGRVGSKSRRTDAVSAAV